MAALGWLMNLQFSGSRTADEAAAPVLGPWRALLGVGLSLLFVLAFASRAN